MWQNHFFNIFNYLLCLLIFLSGCEKNNSEIKQLREYTQTIITNIQNKNSDAILQFIPYNYNIEVWENKFMKKDEIINDFKVKGRIYELFFCGKIIGEESPLCMLEDLQNYKIKVKEIKKINQNQREMAVVYITWDEKEKAKEDKYDITNYLDKLTFIKLNDKWYLHDFMVWENQ